MRTLTLAVGLLCLRSTAIAAISGNELLQRCESAAVKKLEAGTELGAGYCMGFIDASWNETQLVSEFFVAKPTFCSPEGNKVTTGQLIRIVVKYLQDHPAELHKSGTLLVGTAFVEAFPCEAKPK